jgi:hypothetical protein
VSAEYRVQQFFQAVRAVIRPEPGLKETPARYLSSEALSLFVAMPSYDRQHALDVVRALQSEGYQDSDLLAAALLHDAGKTVQQGSPLRLWHRVAVVLLRAAGPELVDRIAEDRPGSWRRPFYVQQCHAALGAELARGAGCSPRTVALIRHHEDPASQVEDPELAAFQAADGAY